MLTMQDFLFESQDIVEENIPALEMYNYQRFRLNYHIWKYAYLNNNYFDINTFQLPWDSIYHSADNLMGGVQQDFPHVENDPIIINETYYKYLYHVTNFDLSSPFGDEEKYVYQTSGLSTQLMAFRSQYKGAFKYLQRLDSIQKKKETFTMLNYNALFRCYTFGSLRYFKKLNLILSTIFNNVINMIEMFPDKHQYILIPLDNTQYTQDQFTRTKKKIDMTTLRYPNSFHYIFMVYLLNFIDPNCEVGLFNKYPSKYFKETNLLLRCGDKGTILNMQDLVDMNVKNSAYLRIVSHINNLCLVDAATLETTVIEDNSVVLGDRIPVIEDTEPTIPLPDITTVTIDKSNTKNTDVSESPLTEPVPITDTEVPTPIVKPVVSTSIVPKIVPMVKPMIPKAVPAVSTPEVKKVITPTLPTMEKTIIPSLVANITTVKPIVDENIVKEQSKKMVEDLDNEAIAFIDKHPDITPKQKERCKVLAKKYKQIQLDDTPLIDILSNNNDVSIDDEPAQAVVDVLPDKSMAKSKSFNFDKSYIDKTMKKDLVAICTSFTANGMFLIDIKKNQIINELTQANEYTLHFEDVEGKKHTVKFSVPIIDSNGYCYINGVKKFIKKQMVNVPICKIGKNKVSLVSNFNKTLVYRNEAKAHSFLTFIDKIVNDNKQYISVVYGTLEINLPISYEYVSLAQKFASITVNKSKGSELWDSAQVTLCFDYYNRFSILANENITPKLDALEKRFGLLLGKVSASAYYFVDTNNRLSLVTLDGKDVTPTTIYSIVDIFKTYLSDESSKKIKDVTEWIDINLVSKPLPVGFILAYRYGLSHILNYLGVKYKLLAKRGTSVLEEGITTGVVGTEALFTKEQLSKVKLMYRSGPEQNIKYFDPRVPDKQHGIRSDEKRIYVSDDPGYAAAFCFEWNDKEGFKLSKTGRSFWVLEVPYKYRDRLYKPCSFYAFSDRDNKAISLNLKTPEYYFKETTKVLDEIQFDTCLACLKKFHVVVKYTNTKTIDIDTRHKWKIDHIDHLELLDKYNIPKDKIVIFGSGSMLAHRYPGTGNQDIDAIVDADIFKMLKSKYNFKPNSKGKLESPDHILELSDTFILGNETYTCNELQKEYSDEIDGYYFLNIPMLYKFYTTMNRPKDQDKIAWLTKHYQDVIAAAENFKEDVWSPKKDHTNGVFFLKFDTRPDSLPKKQRFGKYWHTGIIYNNKVYECFSDNTYKVSPLKERLPELHEQHATFIPFPLKDMDINVAALSRELTSGTCAATYVGRVINIDHSTGDIKTLLPDEVFRAIVYNHKAKVEHLEYIVGNESLTTDRYTYTPGDIVIKFKDCNLVFNRYPLSQSLIIAGLDYFNTQNHNFDEFDTKDVYYTLMDNRGINRNYLKAVRSFFDLFIDPITKDVLEQMHEPTNIKDLLIRTSTLLTTYDHKEASSIANHRLRSYEQFNAIIYNELARAFATYQAGRGKGNTFSVNPNAVFLRIIQNPSFTIVEDVNPIQELKEKAGFTFAGAGGRTSDSFVVDDRRYPVDGIGVIGESTVDNAKVAMNSYLAVDPGIVNTRGLLVNDKKPNEYDATQMFTVTTMMFPCGINDDGWISILDIITPVLPGSDAWIESPLMLERP